MAFLGRHESCLPHRRIQDVPDNVAVMVSPVMNKLVEDGVDITAFHNHLLRSSPTTLYMHVRGHGDPVKLATTLHAALAENKTPFQGAAYGSGQPLLLPAGEAWNGGPATMGARCNLFFRQSPAFAPPFSALRRAVRFDMRGADHQHVRRSPTLGKRKEQIFPYAAARPAHEAVIDRCRGTVGPRAITPPAAAVEHMHIPLMTRRSSARSLPRTSIGKRGFIRSAKTNSCSWSPTTRKNHERLRR
jgi:hypothetical protein